MTAAGLKKDQRKRKQVDGESPERGPFSEAVGLEMLSDEENDEGASGADDGEVEESPEIDTRSDSGDEDFEGSEEDDDSGEEEEEELDDEGQPTRRSNNIDMNDSSEEEDDDDFDDDNEDERFWPTRAQHDEDSFGYAFDSGDHALCMSSHTCYADSRASMALTLFPSLLSLWSRRRSESPACVWSGCL